MSGHGRTRADRLRLSGQLELAAHASELLHSKEEALGRERVRLEGHAARAADEWAAACAAASAALLRADMLGAGEELERLIVAARPLATVTPHWQRAMGITYPGSVDSDPGTAPAITATAALRPAIIAYRRALDAAALNAAAQSALERLDGELADTRRRCRAIDARLRPDLERERHTLDLHLDELDREEAQRIRAAGQRHSEQQHRSLTEGVGQP